ncbi:MAG TPA: transcriptional regulator [Candidatus Krumholzibacteria bacterium]|nr:transcriptional regulator [Candidatus Krumholzibacteria bacterium]
MIRKLMTVALITVLTGIAAPSFAQNDIIELLRSDIATQKKAIMTAAMGMTEQESEVFWPIYNDYQDELRKIGDDRIAMIKEYSDNYETMTDEVATSLSKRAIANQEDRLKLYKKYNGKLAKALSPRMAARWLQTEHAINTMIDVQIASEMPLMK